MAKLNRMARLAQRQFQRLERQVRARVKRRTRTLWGLVRNHVLLHSVAWWWLELPSRSTRFETERCKAIEEFERECGNKRCCDIRQEVPLQRRESHFQPAPSDSSPELAGRCPPSAISRRVFELSHHTHKARRFPTCFPDALHGKS